MGRRLGPELTEEEAMSLLGKLRSAYDDEAWCQKTKSIARKVAFAQRSFLVNLKSKALEIQGPILDSFGLSHDDEGMRSLECALVRSAMNSTKVRELLHVVRVAEQGGPNGMWVVNMEPDENDVEMWADSRAMESRTQYTKVDPFGPCRVNTHSCYSNP